jgi:ATP-dependent DNA helicase RecG
LNAFRYLQAHLNSEYIIEGGPRRERLELPQEALREALLNAIAHRAYFSNANIQVYIFNDRVEITNPGGLVKGMTKKDLGRKSLSRNNLLFGLMQRMNLVEKVGSGIKRMKNAMRQYNVSGPRFETDDNWFTIIFSRTGGKRQDTAKDTAKDTVNLLSENEKKLLSAFEANSRITAAAAAKILKINLRNTKKNITKLKEKGFVNRVGSDKNGYWELANPSAENAKIRND